MRLCFEGDYVLRAYKYTGNTVVIKSIFVNLYLVVTFYEKVKNAQNMYFDQEQTLGPQFLFLIHDLENCPPQILKPNWQSFR